MLSKKSGWLLVLFIIVGIVLGGFLGEYVAMSPYFGWLNYGKQFEFNPYFDINIIKFNLNMVISINLASIIGIVMAMFIYKKAN